MTKAKDLRNKSEGGFSLIMVIFVLLFLSLMGGAISSMISASLRTGVERLDAAQSFYTAQAGLAWAMKNNSGTAGGVPFAGGIFSADKYYWRFQASAYQRDTERHVRGYRTLEYVAESRISTGTNKSTILFTVKNQTGYWILLTHFKLQLNDDKAYFDKVIMRYAKNYQEYLEGIWGTAYTLWDTSWNGGIYGSPDVKYVFKDFYGYWIESGEPVQFEFNSFKTTPSGGDPHRNVSKATFKVYLYSNDPFVDYEHQPTAISIF